MKTLFTGFRDRQRRYDAFNGLGIGYRPSSLLNNSSPPTILPPDVQSESVREHGRIYGRFMGGANPTLVVADHEVLRDVQVKNFADFIDRAAAIHDDNDPSLVNLRGSQWRRVRRAVSRCAFGSARVRSLEPVIMRSVDELCGILRKKGSDSPINVFAVFQVCKAFLGGPLLAELPPLLSLCIRCPISLSRL